MTASTVLIAIGRRFGFDGGFGAGGSVPDIQKEEKEDELPF